MFRGECKTISSAAKKSGVNKGTLQKVLESGQKFQGSGKSLRVFTREEEKIITERYIKLYYFCTHIKVILCIQGFVYKVWGQKIMYVYFYIWGTVFMLFL